MALEVGDIEEALAFYGKIFDFSLRAKRPGNALIELGDQFINPTKRAAAAVINAGISASWSTTARGYANW